MATERIQIIVSERGSREVRRNLQDIGSGALAAEGAVTLLKRALGGLSVGLAVAELVRMADTFTNIQNRLKLVTTSTGELNAVTSELFAIANRTRASFEATSQLYARMALNAKNLGTSQAELLTFTESLNQAVILSGASAREAEGALIQLAQGMASGTLQGDELRSVLEQLPLVADIIAQQMGVTRGELRKLAADGQVTAQVILDAFANARVELSERFAKTIPTIEGSIVVLKNKALELWGAFSTGSGIAAGLATTIIALSNHLQELITIVGALATLWVSRWIAGALVAGTVAVVNFTRSLTLMGAAMGFNSVIMATAAGGFNALKVALTSTAFAMGVLTAAVAVLVAGLIYMAGEAATANRILGGLDQSGRTAANELFDLEAKARAAGMQVDTLSNAAATGNPLLIQIAASYGQAANEAQRLAINARQAAIAVAQGKISELRAQRDTLMRPINNNLGKNGVLAQLGSGVDYYAQRLFGGPDVRERIEGARQLNDQIGIYNEQISLLKEVPDSVFAPRPYTPGPGKPAKERSGRGGGGGRSDAEILADYDRQLTIDTELAALNGAEHARLQSIRQLETQLNRSLTASELEHVSAKLAALQATQDLAMFKDYSDNIRQEVILLGLSNRERERQQEIFNLENTLKRQLTQTERELIDARLDELQVARDAKALTDFREQLTDENTLLRFNGREREVRTGLLRLERDLGRELNPLEREWVELLLWENQALQSQNAILENTVGKRTEFYEKLADAYALLKDQQSGFTEADFFDTMIDGGQLSGFFEGTQAQLDAQLATYQTYYDQIKSMRDLQVIDAQSAAQAMANVEVAMLEARLQKQKSFFGTLAQLSNSKNRELAAIGKAAAVTQATIDGYVAVQKALSAFPPPFNFIAAAAVGAATAANVAGILSQNTNFMTGGSMKVGGVGGPDSQMVAFRASPGEQIDVRTPAQVRKGTGSFGEGGGGQAPTTNMRIINVLDPALVGDYLASPEGEEQFVNIMRNNADKLQQIAGGGG